jgi:predicted nucleotidyltransferase
MARRDDPVVVRKAPSADDAVMTEVVQRLVEAYQPERVYLFGSAGRGDANADSDYDILLVVRDDSPEFLRDGRRGYEVIADFPISVDLVVYTASGFYDRLSLKASLPATVVREGKLLHAAR